LVWLFAVADCKVASGGLYGWGGCQCGLYGIHAYRVDTLNKLDFKRINRIKR